jgi:uncharacterized protein (TIGR02186 family)
MAPRKLLFAAALVPLFVLAPAERTAAELVAALSSNLVAVTTGFTGSDVLLFGTTGGAGEVVVVVRGPESEEVVRRKGRHFGIWVNDAQAQFVKVPGYYAVAATAPIAQILPDRVAARHQIGIDNIRLDAPHAAPGTDVAAFRTALIRIKQRTGLYSTEPAEMNFLGERLFRTDMRIPANAPVGDYLVSVFLVQNGEVTGAEITPLKVNRIGFEARVFEFAHKGALAYGVLAVVAAAVAGWIANVIFQKG